MGGLSHRNDLPAEAQPLVAPLAPPAAPKKTGSSFLSVSMAAHAPSNNDAARTKTGAGGGYPLNS